MCKVVLDYTVRGHLMAKELKFVMLLDCYGDLLTEHQRSVMEMYYCEDLSLAEIGAPMGITRQAVMSLIKRTEGILLNYEKKLGFAERLGKMRECFEELGEAVSRVADEELRRELIEKINSATDLL